MPDRRTTDWTTPPPVPDYLQRPWDQTTGYNQYELELAYRVRSEDMAEMAKQQKVVNG